MNLAGRLEQVLYRVTNPTRYIGNEWNSITREWVDERIKVVLAFPDLYEIGMSHLGLKILYHLLNREDDILCERTYAPWLDMEELMRSEDIPLFSLESKQEIRDFDLLGFTLQYEMSYTNILNMLDLAGIPIYSRDRDNSYPLIIGGGSTVFNPEPLAPFFDLFFIGDAENRIIDLVRTYHNYSQTGLSRREMLLRLSHLPGVYVPRFYDLQYSEMGEIDNISTNCPGIKEVVNKQIVADLDQVFYPVDFIVPYMNIVHDRAVLEIARGCKGGCRFCAAGMTYRPVRERKKETIIDLADRILASTGFEELSLSSLNTADYSDIEELVQILARRYEEKKISISLPSLRIDRFSVNLAREVQRVRKSGLTFAPEAGTQRLRDVINKGVVEEDLYDAVQAAFDEGWSSLKLYFMIGLPTETDEDLAGIVELVKKVFKMGKEGSKQRKRIKIHTSISTFVPRPFTPFQWVEMISREEIISKQNYLKKNLRGRGLSLSWNEPDLSLLEGAFSRGDRRLASVLESAWRRGCKFDGWNDIFDFSLWEEAFRECNLNLNDYLRARQLNEKLPWEHINIGISKEFLIKEYQKSKNEFVGDRSVD
jgi:radical SAM family uncharacterized protein